MIFNAMVLSSISRKYIVKYGVCRGRALSSTSGSDLPKHARVVVCGAGVIGNSIAYHLSLRGWNDTVVIDQGLIGSGTSWHGSGLVGQFRQSNERKLISYTVKLYKQLQEEGHELGWKQCGSLNVARTKDRMISLKRYATLCKAEGLECEIVGQDEMKKLHPYLNVGDLEGAVWVPSDGVVNSADMCSTLSMFSKQAGVKYVENCKVRRMITSNGRITAVETDLGTIRCEFIVNSTGLWARELGEKCDPQVRIPSHAAEHLYFTTTPIASNSINSQLPVMRDYDGSLYIREWKGGFLAGGFEPVVKVVYQQGVPNSVHDEPLSEDFDHYRRLIDASMKRVPIMSQSTVERLNNGAENFTADGKWILGESPEVDNYFVAVGMDGNSVQGAGGVGKSISEWIIDGEPSQDMLSFDVRRFTDLHNNDKFLRERVREIAGRHYSLIYPMQVEFETARKLRCSPLYTEQEAEGAVFGEVMGFERALYYNNIISERPVPESKPSFGKPEWFEFTRDEYMTCREGVGVLDLSSLTKVKLKSPGNEVVDFLQLLCSNDINVPVNSIVQTGMQNEKGGYENDCVLVRREENQFLMICPSVQQTRIINWIQRHLPGNGSVALHDVTSMYTILNVVGPKSMELMNELTNNDMKMMPFTRQEINLGYASGVTALGYTNMGEPGYTLLIPAEYALHVYDRLMSLGKDYGLCNVGYFSLRCMRIEKFIPFWGEELNSNTTPYEIGRGHKVKLEKPYFLGKVALMQQQTKGVRRRLVHFILETHDYEKDLWVFGREPIYRNGVYVGNTTSAGYGFTVGSMVCMGFVKDRDETSDEEFNIITNDFITGKHSHFEIDIAGQRFPMKASLHPPKLPLVVMGGMSTRYIPKVRAS